MNEYYEKLIKSLTDLTVKRLELTEHLDHDNSMASKENWKHFFDLLVSSQVTELSFNDRRPYYWQAEDIKLFCEALVKSKVETLQFNTEYETLLKTWDLNSIKIFGEAIKNSKINKLILFNQLEVNEQQGPSAIKEKFKLLFQAISQSKITHLEIGANYLCLNSSLFKEFCEFLPKNQLHTLGFSLNSLGELPADKVKDFADALTRSKIRSLDIRSNSLSELQPAERKYLLEGILSKTCQITQLQIDWQELKEVDEQRVIQDLNKREARGLYYYVQCLAHRKMKSARMGFDIAKKITDYLMNKEDLFRLPNRHLHQQDQKSMKGKK
jgi:hypothetical protein